MLRMLAFNLLFLATIGLALARGRLPERAVAGTFVIAGFGSMLFLHPYATRYGSLELGVMAFDAAAFIALVAIALFVDRFWPLLVAAMQGVSLLAHLAKIYGSDIMPVVYMDAVQFWSWLQLIVLLLGTVRLELRRAKHWLGFWPARQIG